MARSAITVVAAPYNAATLLTADAFDASNEHEIVISNVSDEKFTILINSTSTTSTVFAVKAGVGQSASEGDLSLTTAAAGMYAVVLESARFKQSNGNVNIDLTGAGTGNFYAINHA